MVHRYIGIYFIVIFWAFSYANAQNNTTQTINGVIQTNSSSPYHYIGETGTNNLLNVINGGSLFVPNGISVIGDGNSANNNRLVINGDGSVFRNSRGIFVGNRGRENQLIVTNGGTLMASNIWIGYDQNGFDSLPLTSSNNFMLVHGSNSQAHITNDFTIGVFAQSNTMMILEGGNVTARSTLVGFDPGSSNNYLLISDSGSTLSNHFGIYIGYSDQGNIMTISNGGKLFGGQSSAIGALVGSSNNIVNIYGLGSSANLASLTIGHSGIRNSLNISNGGYLHATNVFIGYTNTASENSLRMDGDQSSLNITNTVNTGELDIRRGSFMQNGGHAQIDQLMMSNTLGTYAFNGGTTIVQRATVSNSAVFQIGNGTDAAYFRQTDGAFTNTFADGILVNQNAILSFTGIITNQVTLNSGTLAGTGTLTTALTVDNGSVIAPGNSPGNINVATLTFGSLGTYAWEINNFTGTATNNWDFINVSGVLDITATAGSPFTLQLATLDAFNAAGLAQNWDMNVDQAWKILTAGSINGFAADKFSIDLSSFQNPIHPTGGFYVSQVGNDLYLNYNHLATIPEPSTYALLTFLGTFFLFFAGKRRKSMTAAGNG